MSAKVSAPIVRRFLRIGAVLEATGYGKSQLYELIAKRQFPRPVRLSEDGRAVAWDETEIAAWQEERRRRRDEQRERAQ